MRTREFAPEVLEQVVPKETVGGFPKVCQAATDATVGLLTFGGQLLPQAALHKVEQLVLL